MYDTANDIISFEEVVTEEADRDECQSNLVILGLDELDQYLATSGRFTIEQ